MSWWSGVDHHKPVHPTISEQTLSSQQQSSNALVSYPGAYAVAGNAMFILAKAALGWQRLSATDSDNCWHTMPQTTKPGIVLGARTGPSIFWNPA